jgi:hypothetical protein
MKKKVGILTFHASHNYGSMLQAYALSTFLIKLGYDVQIINFRSSPQKMMYAKPFKYWDAQSLKGRLLSPSFFFKNIGKWNKYEAFMRDEMPLTYEINHIADIRRIIIENKYDVVITGSDQIWNLNSPDFSVGYLLPFALPCKKIAYAPSMGHLQWLQMDDVELVFKSTLKDYYALSTREMSTAQALSDLLHKPIVSLPDPAWLITQKEYDDISFEESLIKQKYLFYYVPQHEYEGSKTISMYARFLGIKPVCSSSPTLPCPGFQNYNNSGPKEFLNLVKNADVVCGYSMHLIVFSLLFHKQFFIISDNPDTRISDLLRIFNLEDRIVSTNDVKNNNKLSEIDWSCIDAKIEEFRYAAKDYLAKSINE